MQITLNNFIPNPLFETFRGESDIWNTENLQINQQPATLIVSESGKGKTSLISSIYGLRKDYHGAILFDNKNIKSFTTNDWSAIRSHKLSIVFQSLRLFPELDILDNIIIKNNISKHKTEDEIREYINLLGLEPHIHQAARSLSFGQQQRVAIIRALCQAFETILLDEPFSHLDDENAKKAWSLIKSESEKQGAHIIITALHKTAYLEVSHLLNI